MKFFWLLLTLLSSFVYSQTDCTSGNLVVYDSKSSRISSHTQSYKAELAAMLLSQEEAKKGIEGRAAVKTPDIVCVTAPVLSSSSSRSSSSTSSLASSSNAVSSATSSVASSVSSSIQSSSSSSACAATLITPFYRVGGAWIQDSSFSVSVGTLVDFAPQPTVGGSWTWSGCGVAANTREVTIAASTTCVLTAIHTNSCGTKTTHQFYVNVSAQSSSQSSSVSVSSSVSATATLTWQHPTARVNGDVLPVSEIAGYEIRQWVGSSAISKTVGVVNQTSITGNFQRVEIAVFDKSGLYSDFVVAVDARGY